MTAMVTRAPGKAMLMGEYAVLFGDKALAFALDRQAICSFTPGGSVSFWSKTTEAATHEPGHPLFVACKNVCELRGFSLPTGTYYLDTSSFFSAGRKLGLGSSAAAVTALVRLLLELNGNFDQELLFSMALTAHRDFSGGVGSGVDIATAVYGGMISYQKTCTDAKTEAWSPQFPLNEIIVVDSGKSQDTRVFVNAVHRWAEQDSPGRNHFCEQSRALCEGIHRAQHIDELIPLFEGAFHLLSRLSQQARIDIISREHAQIFELAKSLGGSAKPSGAGGGDIALAVVPSAQRDELKRQLARAEFNVL